MKSALAATMIRPRYLPVSIVAQLVSSSAFLHSLDPTRTLQRSRVSGVNQILTARNCHWNKCFFTDQPVSFYSSRQPDKYIQLGL